MLEISPGDFTPGCPKCDRKDLQVVKRIDEYRKVGFINPKERRVIALHLINTDEIVDDEDEDQKFYCPHCNEYFGWKDMVNANASNSKG